ncbi:hypothetical protein [Streptomyces fuscichromogenes]|uniref:hypothetical protein n=1 Tax=Streptomyces fuscichromogenes TaxID=1324013 RepID=UPI0016717216|nr:hypothetical protein [Streptomyces fuscichromogenes]
MTTRFDDEPEFDGPDDPLAVILRPPAAHLGAPPGRYEEIRRAASRRRFVRTAAGTGLTCAVAACVALSLHLTGPSAPASPRLPLAPPAVSPTAPRHPSTSPAPADPSPSPSVAPTRGGSAREPTPGTPTRSTTQAPSPARSAYPSTLRGASPESEPSAVATSARS